MTLRSRTGGPADRAREPETERWTCESFLWTRPREFTSPLHAQGTLVSSPARLAFVSGQVGVRADGTTGDDVDQQTRIVFENVTRVLAEAGLDLSGLASLTTYLTSHDHIDSFTRAANDCLGGHRPAATLLIVEHLANPALLVQVEAVAVGG